MKLEVSKGHLLWRLSDIAKDADVTRSLIYYYFGKEKEVILQEAFRFMIDLFFNLDRKDSMGIVERLKYIIYRMKSMPWFFILFYMQKGQDTDIGVLLKKAEDKL
jgi:AcrR family transcriptional regulator